jgi:Ser/Thr protein kinase RdoA (MazF antagonist)
MHVSAACIPAVSRLPDRGPAHYLDHLLRARQLIQSNLGHPALSSQDLKVLEAILSQGYLLELQWHHLEALCHRFPRTLVHGDFSKDNVRVRWSTCGNKLVAFDWEMAGYGIPAFDIAEPSGRGVARARVETELVDYCSVVQQSWSDLDVTAIRELAHLGAVFRLLAAISWESLDISLGWLPIEELHRYQANLAVALDHLGFGQ